MGELKMTPKYGVFDSVDKCWSGSNETGTGPLVTDSLLHAQACADIITWRLGWIDGRAKACIIPNGGRGFRFKDELPFVVGLGNPQI